MTQGNPNMVSRCAWGSEQHAKYLKKHDFREKEGTESLPRKLSHFTKKLELVHWVIAEKIILQASWNWSIHFTRTIWFGEVGRLFYFMQDWSQKSFWRSHFWFMQRTICRNDDRWNQIRSFWSFYTKLAEVWFAEKQLSSWAIARKVRILVVIMQEKWN